MNTYYVIELIKMLQTNPSLSAEDLVPIEWSYLPLLDGDQGAVPQNLEWGLATDPAFFCDMIKRIFRSSKDQQQQAEPTDEMRKIAQNAWRLFDSWKTVPGQQKDGSFDDKALQEWITQVKQLTSESGHFEISLETIGKVLIHSPRDPSGLWIHKAVASVLDDKDADHLRIGYRISISNSRGVHSVDPSGKPEEDLAHEWRQKADEVENAGFHRLAVTLRKLADDYEREAADIRARFDSDIGK